MTKILKKLLLFFSIAAAAIYFTSCEKYSYLIKSEIIDDVSYSEQIQPIFDAKCVSCHRGTIAPDLRPENSYKALSEGGYLTPAENSKLYEYVFIKSSHVSYTSQDERNLIYSWLLQGAKEEAEDNSLSFFQ